MLGRPFHALLISSALLLSGCITGGGLLDGGSPPSKLTAGKVPVNGWFGMLRSQQQATAPLDPNEWVEMIRVHERPSSALEGMQIWSRAEYNILRFWTDADADPDAVNRSIDADLQWASVPLHYREAAWANASTSGSGLVLEAWYPPQGLGPLRESIVAEHDESTTHLSVGTAYGSAAGWSFQYDLPTLRECRHTKAGFKACVTVDALDWATFHVSWSDGRAEAVSRSQAIDAANALADHFGVEPPDWRRTDFD